MSCAKTLGTLAVLVTLCGASPARAIMWEIVPGSWQHQGLTFRIHPKHRFTFVIDEKQRGRTRVTGTYKVTAVKFSSKHATLKVATIRWQDRRGKRRRGLKSTPLLGTLVFLGQELRFTHVTGCTGKRDWLQLCLHTEGEDGKPHVGCQTFHRRRVSRHACPPPVDGSKLNPPPAIK